MYFTLLGEARQFFKRISRQVSANPSARYCGASPYVWAAASWRDIPGSGIDTPHLTVYITFTKISRDNDHWDIVAVDRRSRFSDRVNRLAHTELNFHRYAGQVSGQRRFPHRCWVDDRTDMPEIEQLARTKVAFDPL